MTAEELLRAGMEAARQRNREEASRLLSQAVKANPNLEDGSLWLGLCRTDPKERAYCFRRTLAINPNNPEAKRRLSQLNGTAPASGPVRSSNTSPATPRSKAKERNPITRSKSTKDNRIILWGGLGILVCLGTFVVAGLYYWLRMGQAIPTTNLPTQPAVATLPSSTPQNYTANFEAGACPFVPPAGSTVDCGFVTVPEDRSGDLSDTLRLAIAIYRSASPNPAADPIIYVSGGPGEQSLDWSIHIYSTVISPLIAERDFIVFDQRGIGYSQPVLDCDEISDTYLKDLRGKLPAGQELLYYQGAVASCHNKLTQQGINPQKYNSVASAADIKDIIRTLGYRQANLYAISYGTRIAQVIMRDYPEVVRSGILDSIVPVDTNLLENTTISADDQTNLVMTACANDPLCAAAYPNLAQTYAEVIQNLEQQPITLPIYSPDHQLETEQVDGDKFTNAILIASKYSNTLPLVPQAINRARQGDYAAIEMILSSPSHTMSDLVMAVSVSFFCHEQVQGSTPERLGTMLFDLCELWGSDSPAPGENDAVHSDIPTLLITGKFDPTTPPFLAEQVQQGLTQSYLVTFTSQAHVPSLTDTSGCSQVIINSFLENPTSKPDTTCLQADDRISFTLPYTGDPPLTMIQINIRQYGINAKIPSGWTNLGEGFFGRSSSLVDRTVIGIQKSQVSETQWKNWLVTEFNPYGVDNPPTQYDVRSINSLKWNLYKTTSDGLPVEIAFATSGTHTIMVLLMSHPDEHQSLYETVFLPVLDSLEP